MKRKCPFSRVKTNIILSASNCPALQRIENGAAQDYHNAVRGKSAFSARAAKIMRILRQFGS